MPAASPTPSFPGAWPDSSSSDVVPPLPDKYVPPVENGDTPQDISPSLICLSPRPIPELPSLSSSLSTADSSETDGASTPPSPLEQPCSPVEVQPACTPLQTDLPVVLDLREPHSPDSAHFSPAIDSTSFPSPSSSRLQLSLSNNCPGSRSFESVATATFLPSPSSPDDERGETQDEQSRSIPTEEGITDARLQGDRQEYSPRPAKMSIGKRTFLSRVKRFGGRVRKLFKPRVVETRARHNSVSSLVSPRKSSLAVSLRPASESARSHQGPEAQYFIPRRFSLQSLLHSRMPSGSADSNSRAGNRLSTIVSARDEDWPSRSPNAAAAAADVAGILIVDYETGITAD